VGYVLSNAWALLLGMLLLMIGNGLQGTLLAVRGGLQGFDETTMFAALASLISAAFIIYPAVPDPVAWTLLRVIVGVCISGVYVVPHKPWSTSPIPPDSPFLW